jgi:MerR family transcriptional regulator/heat shock protein HspR
MNWQEINEQFGLNIEEDEPVFPVNVVCQLAQLNYWTLHEIIKEGIIDQPIKSTKSLKAKGPAKKKLFSCQDVKVLKYVHYLMEEKGVNVQGVKIILQMKQGEEI